MRVLAVYFSHTGTTETAMRAAVSLLEAAGCEVRLERIRPEVDLPPPLWLAQSFFPGSRAPIHPVTHDPRDFDACLLGLPKWTFACPPVNAYLVEHGESLPPTAVAVTCGGWDQERYLEELDARLTRMGVSVVAGLTLRRREIESQETVEDLSGLVTQLAAARPGNGGSRKTKRSEPKRS